MADAAVSVVTDTPAAPPPANDVAPPASAPEATPAPEAEKLGRLYANAHKKQRELDAQATALQAERATFQAEKTTAQEEIAALKAQAGSSAEFIALLKASPTKALRSLGDNIDPRQLFQAWTDEILSEDDPAAVKQRELEQSIAEMKADAARRDKEAKDAETKRVEEARTAQYQQMRHEAAREARSVVDSKPDDYEALHQLEQNADLRELAFGREVGPFEIHNQVVQFREQWYATYQESIPSERAAELLEATAVELIQKQRERATATVLRKLQVTPPANSNAKVASPQGTPGQVADAASGKSSPTNAANSGAQLPAAASAPPLTGSALIAHLASFVKSKKK